MGLTAFNGAKLRRSISSAEEDSHVALSTNGRLFSVLVTSSAGATTYLQVWDGASAGSGSLVWYLPIGATSYGGMDFGIQGVTMETGVVAALSSTATTFTTAGAVGWFVVNTD